MNDAVIHIRQVKGKEALELHLCEECAKERGITAERGETELSISGLLSSLIDIKKVSSGTHSKKKCHHCGVTIDEIKKKRNMGCQHCYVVFEQEVRSFLKKNFGFSVHKGKLPRSLQSYKTFFMDIEKLKVELREAVIREDYEKAARIRDKIKELENPRGAV